MKLTSINVGKGHHTSSGILWHLLHKCMPSIHAEHLFDMDAISSLASWFCWTLLTGDWGRFFSHLHACGLFSSCSLTAWIFSSDLPVFLLPEFPLFRFKLVPCSRYLLTLRQTLDEDGGLRPGKAIWNCLNTATTLFVSKYFSTMNVKQQRSKF